MTARKLKVKVKAQKETHLFTKIVGVTFDDRQKVIKRHVRPGRKLLLMPEPNNPVDKKAVAVYTAGGFITGPKQIGYLNKKRAAEYHKAKAKKQNWTAKVKDVTGGGKESLGVNIRIDW